MIYRNQRKPEFWNSIRNNPEFTKLINDVKEGYTQTVEKGLEPLLVYKYNLYNETGDRSVYENDYFARRRLLTSAFILSLIYPENAEYFKKLESVMWAICDEFNWVLPAHNSTHKIDLCSSETGLLLIECIAFAGERMDIALKERVISEVKNRVIDVYENNDFVWEKYTSNWTAVCTGCVAISMMYAFPDALERSIERITKASEVFLSGFSDEGVCFEGPVYWGYGFGNFVYLADALFEFTVGKINLFDIEKTKKVAEYPKYSVLCGGASVSFSDSSRIARFSKGVVGCLNKHYKNLLSDEYLVCAAPLTNFQNALIRQFIFADFKTENLKQIKQDYFLPSAGQKVFNRDGYSFVRKAITFSFDDGNIDDVRLIEILNKYNLKGTFNLNSSMLADNFVWNYENVKDVHHINFSEHPHLYDGHEVASHTVRHPHLENMSYVVIKNEIELDRIYSKALYGYEILGMALPFGTYNDEVVKVLKDVGILYCRTVEHTYKFDMPNELPLLHPTCHFKYKDLDRLTDEFLNAETNEDMFFYIWGHSYELVTEEDWEKFEAFCNKIANRNDIYYCTNKEAILNHNT